MKEKKGYYFWSFLDYSSRILLVVVILAAIYGFVIHPYQNREEMLNTTTGNFTIVADKTHFGKEFNTFPYEGKTEVKFLWMDRNGEINEQYIKYGNIDFNLTDNTEQISVNFNVLANQFDYVDLTTYNQKYNDPSDLVNNGQKITVTMTQHQYNYYFSAIPAGDYQY